MTSVGKRLEKEVSGGERGLMVWEACLGWRDGGKSEGEGWEPDSPQVVFQSDTATPAWGLSPTGTTLPAPSLPGLVFLLHR